MDRRPLVVIIMSLIVVVVVIVVVRLRLYEHAATVSTK
jgi:hypothetical protein